MAKFGAMIKTMKLPAFHQVYRSAPRFKSHRQKQRYRYDKDIKQSTTCLFSHVPSGDFIGGGSNHERTSINNISPQSRDSCTKAFHVSSPRKNTKLSKKCLKHSINKAKLQNSTLVTYLSKFIQNVMHESRLVGLGNGWKKVFFRIWQLLQNTTLAPVYARAFQKLICVDFVKKEAKC